MGARSASNFDPARVAELDRLAGAMRPGWEHADGPLAIHAPVPPAPSTNPGGMMAPAAPPAPPSVDDAAATNVLPALTEAKISEIEPEELLPADLVTDPIHPPGTNGVATAVAAPVPVADAPKPASFPPPAPRTVSSAPPAPRAAPVPRAVVSSPSLSDALPAIRPSRKPLWIGLGIAAIVGGGLVYAFRSGGEEATPTPAAPTATASATAAAPKMDIPPVPAATETSARTESAPVKPSATPDTTTTAASNASSTPTVAATPRAAITPPPTHTPVTPPPAPHTTTHAAHSSGGGAPKSTSAPKGGSGGIVRDVPF